jgi:hypothetical protein
MPEQLMRGSPIKALAVVLAVPVEALAAETRISRKPSAFSLGGSETMGTESNEFFDGLEAAGLDEVRARLAAERYGEGGRRRQLAQEWVLRKEQAIEAESQRSRDATQSSQAVTASRAVEEARRAADAAERAASAVEEQARQAQKANRVAITALAIAIIGAIIAVISFFKGI